MLGLVGATFSVMTFTYLVVLFECLLLSMMWFICTTWFQTNKERKKPHYIDCGNESSMEQKFLGAMELSFPGAKVHGNESSIISSNLCNSYQIKLLTSVQTLSLPLNLFISSFPYRKPNSTCSKRNRCGSSLSVVFTHNNVTNPKSVENHGKKMGILKHYKLL